MRTSFKKDGIAKGISRTAVFPLCRYLPARVLQ